MNKKLYRMAAWGLDELVWGGTLVGEENLPENGPAVFVSNHLGALGPIAVGACLPYQLHFWVHGDMLDPRLAADYLRRDFMEGQLHLAQPISGWLAGIVSKIHVPFLRAVGGIPVHHTQDGRLITFQISLDLLEKGEYILILPEDPELPPDPHYQMAPLKGFVRLGEMFYERTKESCHFFHWLCMPNRARSGQANRFDTIHTIILPGKENALKNQLEKVVHEMYLQASSGKILQLPLPN